MRLGVLFAIGASLTGCASKAADLLNPFAEEAEVELGDRNNKALLGEAGTEIGEGERARRALEVAGSYQRALAPQPYKPVMQPAEVRLMWVPDHLNKTGDLVPAHYYYLKVLSERWAVQDAFELEEQLNAGSTGGGSATPWQIKSNK